MAKPRPKAKTEEPTPPAPAWRPRAPEVYDPAVDALSQGLQALQKKDWSRAAELFESALAQSDRSDVSARARQFLASARQQLAPAAPGKVEDEGDPFLQAVFLKNHGDFAAALESCRKDGRDQTDERFAYLAAAIHASEGRIEEAAQALSHAIELNPQNRVHAYHDSDFADLRKDRDHRQLFTLS
jgi:tetratricopeptide (TPR) repeat protein